MDPKATLRPNTVLGKQAVIKIKDFRTLYSDAEGLGLSIVGCDFFQSEHEAKGYSPPEWRSRNIISGSRWLCAEQGHEWSFIANSAFVQKRGLLCDIASRVSHQIRACEWRLRQLSEAYCDQLFGRLQTSSFKEGERFLDGYTSLCYLALQSFLVDACVLRDYLSEFYVEAIVRVEDPALNKISTLSGLLKMWKAKPPKDSAGKEMYESAKAGQWLFELGAYRDLVVHVAPLANAGRTLMASTRIIQLRGGQELPAIKLPLPPKPADLKRDRVTGDYFDDPEMNFARLRNVIEDVSSCRDALEYAHLSMQQLAAMCSSVAKVSPIKPQMPMIIPTDLKVNPSC
ncbi:hypothetical protein [Pseudomonas sp. R45(2017)]|uniref:hypothetical protein n=1 Tax=Pseudomonas sp. R45(2017) TaxID=1981678 RepID=UPI00111C5E7F|nr:hypothetical protein [Pseudomonas sp. R45(2017)]